MRPEIKPPKEFIVMRRMNMIKLKGDHDLEVATCVYPPYYEYILELLDSKIKLKGSSLCDPMLDQVLKAVNQQSHHRIRVNVKIKSISSIREFQMHPEIKINFKIESLNDE
jgi:hypothetical protein